jgi:hypothetical protein
VRVRNTLTLQQQHHNTFVAVLKRSSNVKWDLSAKRSSLDEFCDLLREWSSEHIPVYIKEDNELWHESYSAGDWDTWPTNQFYKALMLVLYHLQYVPWLSVKNFNVKRFSSWARRSKGLLSLDGDVWHVALEVKMQWSSKFGNYNILWFWY